MAFLVVALATGCGGGGGGGISPTPTPTPTPGTPTLPADARVVSTLANDLIYAPGKGRLYISIPSKAGAMGNSIAPVNPGNGAIGTATFVGSEPGQMALSDDGVTLYVALNGADAVRRINLTTGTPDLQFSLGSNSFSGPYHAGDMAVAPGHPDWLAVVQSLGGSPSAQSVALFINGIQSPTVPAYYTLVSRIAFGSTANRLYGYNDESTGFDLYRLDVTDSGISKLDDKGNIISGFGTGIYFSGGRLYADSGEIVDPETGTLIATLAQRGAVCPDPTRNRIFVAATGFSFDGIYTLYAFDATQFTPIASRTIKLPVPQTPTGAQSVLRLVRWGANGLAFLTADGRVVIVDNAP